MVKRLKRFISNLYIKHSKLGLPPAWLIKETYWAYTRPRWYALPLTGRERAAICLNHFMDKTPIQAVLVAAEQLDCTYERVRQIICKQVRDYLNGYA